MLKDKLILLIELCVLFGLFLLLLYVGMVWVRNFLAFWKEVGKVFHIWTLVPVTAIHQSYPIPKILLGLRSKINSNPAGSWGPKDRQARCW